MKIGDTVVYRGIVTDIIGGSVLTRSAFDEREHWFIQDHLKIETAAAEPLAEPLAEAMGTSGATSVVQTSDEIEKAVGIVKAHGYSEEAAREIVSQIGPEVIVKEDEEKKTPPPVA